MTYAKLKENGTLEILKHVPNVSNPKEETIKAYAEENGYKPVVYTDSKGKYYTPTWKEYSKNIKQVWKEMPLEEAKAQALDAVQRERNAAMATTRSLPTPFGWDVEYTPEAVSLAQGSILMMLAGLTQTTSWTDAENVRHEGLTLDDMKAIGGVFAQHIQSIQDVADAKRAAIQTA